MEKPYSRFENLSALLAREGAVVPEIKEAFVLKLGAFAIAETEMKFDSDFPIEDRENLDLSEFKPPDGLPKLVFAAIAKHPNVFEPKFESSDKHELIHGGRFGMLVEGPLSTFRLHIPKRQQKYREMDTDENFGVLSAGSVFIAYTPIRDTPVFTNIGHEFREIANTQIEKETQFQPVKFGPSPIHPDFILVLGELSAGIEKQVCVINENVYIVVNQNERSAEGWIRDVFYDYGFLITLFYSVQLDRNDSLYYSIEITNLFRDLSGAMEGLIEAPAWRIWETRSLAKRSRSILSKIHTRMVASGIHAMMFERDRSRFLERLKKAIHFSKLFSYFAGMTDPDEIIPNSLSTAVQFYEHELHLFGNIRSLLFASLIGAVVGSILAGLLTLLFRR